MSDDTRQFGIRNPWCRYPALLAIVFAGMVIADGAAAKELVYKVDARTRPWLSSMNSKFAFGVGDGRAPTVVVGYPLPVGLTVKFKAKGLARWITNGPTFGPNGDPSLALSRSIGLLPANYIQSRDRTVYMLQVVGAFVNADGVIVGQPFSVGSDAAVPVPAGAAAISLGINDDQFSDNSGTFEVTVTIPEPSVTVEELR